MVGPGGEGESPRDAKELSWLNWERSMGFKKLGEGRKEGREDVTVETLRCLRAQSDIANVRLGF